MSKRNPSETYGISWDINRYDSSLTPMARLIYIEVCKLCNAKGYCWARNSFFAEKYGLSLRTVSRHLQELEGKYIVISGKGSKRLIYQKDLEDIDVNVTSSESKSSRKSRQKSQYFENETETEMSMEHRQECLQSTTEMSENEAQESLQVTTEQCFSSTDDAVKNINNNITSNIINESPLPDENFMLASLAYDKSPYSELYKSLSDTESKCTSSAQLESKEESVLSGHVKTSAFLPPDSPEFHIWFDERSDSA
ncbi:MAG: helix-turn-helix domain-containing protein [Accumulibacter sp.]